MMSDKQLSAVVEAEIMIPHPPLEINISTCYVRSREISGLCYKAKTDKGKVKARAHYCVFRGHLRQIVA